MADDKEDKLEVISDYSPTSLSSGYGHGSTYGIPSQKKRPPNKRLLLIIAAVVLVLIIGGVIAFVVGQKSATPNLEESNVITTATADDLPKVCQGKVLSNAASVETPFKFAAYMKQNGKEFVAYSYYGKGVENLSYLLTEVNTVACLVPDESTATGNLECHIKNVAGDKTFLVFQKGVTYDVTFYVAQTGAKITEGKVKTAVGTNCPSYIEQDGTYYTVPTSADTEAVFTEFLSKSK